MKNKYIFIVITFLLITNIFSQTNLNDYKYVVVPIKYDFLKKADKYQLNSLTKFLLEKENFTVFFDKDSLPEELAKNRCLALYINVFENNSMFRTKLNIELADCSNKTIFKTQDGISREKEYKKAYHEALRVAFQSFKTINYSYKPKQMEQEIVEVKQVNESIVEKPIAAKEVLTKKNIVKQITLKPITEQPVKNQTTFSKVLYAQVINNGFQVVDNSPKVVMKLISTPKQNVFIVKGQDAIVYEQDGFWYIAKDNKSPQTLNIKF